MSTDPGGIPSPAGPPPPTARPESWPVQPPERTPPGSPPPPEIQRPSGGSPPPGPPPPGAPPNRPGRTRVLVIVLSAMAVVAVAAAGLVVYLVLRTPPLTFGDREIAEAEATLVEGESVVEGVVDERNGATNDQTRCYFSLPEGEESEVNEFLRCGPVLFVDGDPDEAYLSVSFEAGNQSDDAVVLDVAPEPLDPDPTGLDEGETLRRADGLEPPDGAGGLEPPQPPRAEAGLFSVHALDGVELEDPGPEATIVSFSRTYAATGLATPERFGQGDEARRAAEGEMLVAVELEIGSGREGVAQELPRVEVQVDDALPQPVPAEVGELGTVGMILSVPDDADVVDLIVTEVDVAQRLSLLTGEPASQNLSVLRRANRGQALNASQAVAFTASQPGFLTETFTITPTVQGVDLYWFFGSAGRIHPADPNRAYLVVAYETVWPETFRPDTAIEEPFWTLTLPDGTAIAAVNVDENPTEFVTIAFDVPADFTEGTITIGGRHTFPEGDTWDFGSNQLSVPVSIPAG